MIKGETMMGFTWYILGILTVGLAYLLYEGFTVSSEPKETEKEPDASSSNNFLLIYKPENREPSALNSPRNRSNS